MYVCIHNRRLCNASTAQKIVYMTCEYTLNCFINTASSPTGQQSSTSWSDYEDSWDYVLDENYNGPPSQSLPCFNRRGVSYTPPGWKRKYKRKLHVPKKLKYDKD